VKARGGCGGVGAPAPSPAQFRRFGGALTGFQEVETAHRTSVFGNVAQRVSAYMKSGVLEGAAFQMRGVKVFQFIRTADGWRISAVSWDDEREGIHVRRQPRRDRSG
jgi:hypothetical protein